NGRARSIGTARFDPVVVHDEIETIVDIGEPARQGGALTLVGEAEIAAQFVEPAFGRPADLYLLALRAAVVTHIAIPARAEADRDADRHAPVAATVVVDMRRGAVPAEPPESASDIR